MVQNPHAAVGMSALLRLSGLALCVALLPALAQAQDGLSGRTLTLGAAVEGLVTASERSASGLRTSDQMVELRPSFFLSSRSGRLVGSLSYTLGLSYHKGPFDGQNVTNQLSSQFSLEALERFVYVDVAASINQQNRSAYGQQSAPDSAADNPNRVEVGTLTVSPYVRGVFASAVSYELRLNASGTNGRRSIAADSTTTGGSLALSSTVPGSLVGWGLTANHAKLDYRAGRETVNDRYSASLSFRPDADLTLDLRGGQEKNDIASVSQTTYSNWGTGLTWRPSPRTRAQLQYDDRYFGRGYQVLLEHRLASTSLQFTSSRDAGNGISGASQPGQGITIYQALDQLLAAQYPDPVDRDAQIRARLGNINPGTIVGGGGINSAVTVSERHQLTATYGAPRFSGSFQLYRSQSKVVDAVAAANHTQQWGYVGTASYRLTPTASVNVTGSKLVTQASQTNAGSELKSLTLGWADQLARRTVASLNLRYSVFNSNPGGYREGAVSASLSQRF